METSAIRTLAASSWGLHPGSPQPGGEILDSQRIYHIYPAKIQQDSPNFADFFQKLSRNLGFRPHHRDTDLDHALPCRQGVLCLKCQGSRSKQPWCAPKHLGLVEKQKKEHESMVVLGDGVIGFSSLATLRITSSTSSWYELTVESQHVSQHVSAEHLEPFSVVSPMEKTKGNPRSQCRSTK